MTDRQPPPTDWPDERLTEAFRARASAHPAPGGISTMTMDRVRVTSRGPTARPRLAYLGGLVAAVVVVAIALAVVARPWVDETGTSTQVLGLPILTVTEAIAVRDAGVDDRELAVEGFLTGPGLVRCPFSNEPRNPTLLRCPQSTTWLMAAPESLITRAGNTTTGRGPTGPAINPSFAQVDQPPGHPLPAQGGSTPTSVVLIGHFDDRRARLCPPASMPACGDTFIVDRVDTVEGSELARSVRLDLVPPDGGPSREPAWTSDEVIDRLQAVFPGLEPLSVVALPGERIGELEPSLGTGVLGILDRPIVWLATGVNTVMATDPPVRRTFLIADDTSEAWESVPWDVEPNVGFAPFPLVGTQLPSDDPSATPRPSSPESPRAVLGLGVTSVKTALELHPNFDNAELAIRGWYVSPDPTADCPTPEDRIRPVRPPACPQRRHWLLDEPEQLWPDPRSAGFARQPSGPYLNPIIPSDVVFDVPDPWSGSSPDPVPVVVVGHFADPRITDTYAGNESFVVDQLVWAAGNNKPQYAVRLIDETVESGTDVLARIDRALGPALLSWISIVHGHDLAILDERVANSAPELTAAATVWVVRRLVNEEVDGVVRTVVDFAYTADRDDRVWSGNSCCTLELATTIDVQLPVVGTSRGTVEILDHARIIDSARSGTADAFAGWRPVGPAEGWWLEVAPGATPREVAVRWNGDACDTTWSLTIRAGPWLDLSRPFVDGCETTSGIKRVVVLTFDQPIDIDSVSANDNTSGG